MEDVLESDGFAAFRADVLAGLARRPRSIPCRWLYDDRGSTLFEEITGLAEYYPTRTEHRILTDNLTDIAGFMGRHVPIVEYGAGSALKTELVLGAAMPAEYLPVDISENMLRETARRIVGRFPTIRVTPVVGDFMNAALPTLGGGRTRTAFFPGSTIGNLEDGEIDALFARMREHVGSEGRALIGMDLRKPLNVLLPAYDDSRGVTAAFDLNLLHRINRELDGTFVPDRFRHQARWNEQRSAVEMHLVSLMPQQVAVAGVTFEFAEGETIHTESSRKFSIADMGDIASRNGWRLARTWLDADRLFALAGFECA